ncbi:hypothetical protein AV530_010486 [Patagioenas fasciata monilis]|uniref:Uncharacterized protein n=1 Tax=Patagioenas fasciata monilis TaxID=372326 RepID=A0A1V4KF50_PATFA|nr:hypothetical protein AV530_010486 [Patagioenas fasciata monilis]
MVRIAKRLCRPKEAAEFPLLEASKNSQLSSKKMTPTRQHCLKVVGQEVRTSASQKGREDENEPQDKPGMDALKTEGVSHHLPCKSRGSTHSTVGPAEKNSGLSF